MNGAVFVLTTTLARVLSRSWPLSGNRSRPVLVLCSNLIASLFHVIKTLLLSVHLVYIYSCFDYMHLYHICFTRIQDCVVVAHLVEFWKEWSFDGLSFDFSDVKSMLSVGLASIACCDYNMKKVANGKETMRVLCIGHGGGSLPLFLASKLQGIGYISSLVVKGIKYL